MPQSATIDSTEQESLKQLALLCLCGQNRKPGSKSSAVNTTWHTGFLNINRFNRAQQLALLISTDFYWSFTPDTPISARILVHMNITKGPQSSPTAPRSGAVAWNGVCATCSCWMIWGNGRKNYKETAWPMAQWPNGETKFVPVQTYHLTVSNPKNRNCLGSILQLAWINHRDWTIEPLDMMIWSGDRLLIPAPSGTCPHSIRAVRTRWYSLYFQSFAGEWHCEMLQNVAKCCCCKTSLA